MGRGMLKWRSGGSDIMLLDHPTRGLDIGAKEDVYEMIRDMCDDGVGPCTNGTKITEYRPSETDKQVDILVRFPRERRSLEARAERAVITVTIVGRP